MTLKLPQLFGSTTQPPVAGTTGPTARELLAQQRQALRTALQETLERNGIAPSWVGLDALVRTGRSQEQRLDVRLVIRHWDPRLVLGSMALQEHFRRRLQELDPQSGEWMTALSWQFALPAEASYPGLEPQRPADATQARPPQGCGTAAQAAGAARKGREQLEKMFSEPAEPQARADRAYAATQPAALH